MQNEYIIPVPAGYGCDFGNFFRIEASSSEEATQKAEARCLMQYLETPHVEQ